MQRAEPLVSVVTPVYNGEKYLVECIESVLAQSYGNWEYIFVNNCSTDRTLEIARAYAAKDARIHVHTNDHLLPVMQNHNHAVSFMSADSKYCKILQADDWLFPDCLQRMVDVAESSATVGVVGSFSLAGMWVRCDGLPYPSTVVPGRELCASTLRGELYPFWSPSSLLIRSDVVRKRRPFYSEQYTHGDVEAMYEVLQEWDFGFAHQVLTYIREHEGSVTSASSKPLNVHLWSNLAHFVKYGPVFLSEKEFKIRQRQMLDEYYKYLADSFYERRDRRFWKYHREGLKSLGYPIRILKLFVAVVNALLCNPRGTVRRILTSFGLKK